MPALHGKHLIGGDASAESENTFQSVNPATGEVLPTVFHEATEAEIDRAMTRAAAAFDAFRKTPVETRARFLEVCADEIEALGDPLLQMTQAETGHPQPRCLGERGRATGQARMFAQFIREGSWVDARIDLAQPDRQPLPKPDVRSMMMPVGPVVVFGASNFPLAISVFGADTVSAFAAGCPVVVKAHPAHPGTCEMVAGAILAAIEKCGLPPGIFSLVHGRTNAVGVGLVQHPETTAAAFTGSLRGGRALYDAAAARRVPIPFYAEMGSVNPIFVLPGALKERGSAVAAGYIQSLTLGVGQFCTNPGLAFGLGSAEWDQFVTQAAEGAKNAAPATMLHAGIHHAFVTGVRELQERSGLRLAAQSSQPADAAKSEAACHVFETDADGLRQNPELYEEIFGPVSTVVKCAAPAELEEFASQLDGSLTASLHGTEEDLATYRGLIDILEKKVGRLIFNGFPTGIEVCHAMHHGGPYPASSHSFFTSIGTRCIERFVRPVCFQGWPQSQLPEELRDDNPRGILRLQEGVLTRDPVTRG
ncbi:MAG: aldehyde dehydrogenase (NADP(+)) [Verrucomicrobiales bacterium]|nr:aldehyde dehydrogenase (NADP(+)) [Verrucomicrobiales bacterium]